VEFGSSSEEEDDDEEENREKQANFLPSTGNVLISVASLQNYLVERTSCKLCGGSIKIITEDCNYRHGIGTKLFAVCENKCPDNGFFTTEKSNNSRYDINIRACLGMRAIGKMQNAAAKFFSIMDMAA